MAKKLTKNLIYNAKQVYFQNNFIVNSKNIKLTWKFINEALGRKTVPLQLPSMIYENQRFENPIDIATALNNHFCSTAENLCNSIPLVNFEYAGPSVGSSFYINPVQEQEINIIIQSFQSKDSIGGLDEFSVKHVKSVVDIISKPLSYLFNLCIEQGIFPKILKISKVVPIHKSGSKDNPNNYRPIALQSIFSKILEKLLKVRLNVNMASGKRVPLNML